MQQTDFIRRTWPFLLIAFTYILVGLCLEKYYGTYDLHLLLNSYNTPFTDVFFKYLTRAGEGIFGLFIIIFFIKRFKYKHLMIVLSSVLLQTIIVRGLKKTFYIDHWRPGYYFLEKGIDLHLVEGIKQGVTFSFPSGHSATVFMLLLFFCIIFKNRWIQAFFGITAVLGAYSRIYLSQHFMEDTIAGGLIGVLVVIISYYTINFRKAKWLNKHVIKRK